MIQRFLICLCLLFSFGCQEDDNEIVYVHTCVDRWPSWSPDGKYIAFYRNPIDQYLGQTVALFQLPIKIENSSDTLEGLRLLDLETRDIIFLTEGYAPDWSPYGDEIAYNARLLGEIWKINMGTGETHEITDFLGMSPDWSPDGSQIVCEKTAGEGIGVYIVDTTGYITQLYNSAVEPSWHPSGNELVFLAQFGNQYGICIGDTSGNIIRLIRESTGQAYPEFSPDTSRIVYHRLEDVSIHVMDTLGGNDVVLARGLDPSWSPDGQKIVYVAADTTGDEICYSLWMMNADGSGRERLTYSD